MSANTFVSSSVNEAEPLKTEEARKSVREDVLVIENSLQFINDFLRYESIVFVHYYLMQNNNHHSSNSLFLKKETCWICIVLQTICSKLKKSK